MTRFKDFWQTTQTVKQKNLSELTLALEHQIYKNIPGTQNSYRIDSQNTSTLSQRHAHVYAKSKGEGKQIYSVNLDGTGHDGSTGKVIPVNHGAFFRSLGFAIPTNLALESLDFNSLNEELYEICILSEIV